MSLIALFPIILIIYILYIKLITFHYVYLFILLSVVTQMCLACQKPTRSLRHRIRFGQGRKGRQRQRNSDQERQGEYLHYLHYLHYLIIEFVVSFQVRMELGIADHVWQQTRATIALTVDSLSDDFRPLFRAGWLGLRTSTRPVLCSLIILYALLSLFALFALFVLGASSMWILLDRRRFGALR